MIPAIHRKLLRSLWRIKGQVLAIALVIAAAVTGFIMYLGAFESLQLTQAAYYERYRFADVFASLKRGPRRLEDRIREIPGVAQAELRVSADVSIDIPGMAEPAVAQFVSIPSQRRTMLNDVFIRRGRYIDPNRRNEVLVNEGFALAHGLEPGDSIAAVVNGTRRNFAIAGVALSPEFVYIIRPGNIVPDNEHHGVVWMNERDLAAAFDMEGAFNDVVLRLMPGASRDDVIAALDGMLERYGGRGAIPRDIQLSHWFLTNELSQLQSFGTIVPIIFLAVAAFLLNVVLGRIVTLEREQIAMLKALGYSNLEIGLHYYLWAVAVAVTGIAIGIGCGAWLASEMVNIYNDFFRFPILEFRISPSTVAAAVAVSMASALLGARGAVRRAVRLPPAEAMRPQTPAQYTVSLIERLGLGSLLSPPTRIIVRNLTRRPFQTLLSIVGIAFGAAMVVEGSFFIDAMNTIMATEFNVAQRQDLTVTFVEPRSAAAMYEVVSLDGVMNVEPMRAVPVRLRFGHRSRHTSITGLAANPDLMRVVHAGRSAISFPPGGLVLSRQMSRIIGASEGDNVTVEVLEGSRPTHDVTVARVVNDYLGAFVYMEIDTLNDLMRESRVVSGAVVQVDPLRLDAIYDRLKNTPSVASVALKEAAVEGFRETLQQNVGIVIFFNQLFASVIVFGVIYNAARISLSERVWELASLRVLGFTKGEIDYVLLGEFALLTTAAIPAGLLLGYGLAWLTVETIGTTELYRVPLVVGDNTYVRATISVLVATLVSSAVVRRRLHRLDLTGVLKSRG